MGSLAKRLGQWSRKSLESESASIFKGIKANKLPGSLSMTLDTTLKEGHDMKVFGVGTLASMACRQRYHRFLTNLHAIYSTMEEELDATSIPAIKTSVIRPLWHHHEGILRRSDRLKDDLNELEGLIMESDDENSSNSKVRRKQPAIPRVSPCTLHYLQAIRLAGEVDRETGGGRLLGHLYCRYLADLFGGQMLGRPYQLALQLPRPPRHLEFEFNSSQTNRRALIEDLYADLNKAGRALSPQQRQDVQKESLLAFQHNVHVYSEEPIYYDGVRGGFNAALGWVTSLS